jgi:hypothetical protein
METLSMAKKGEYGLDHDTKCDITMRFPLIKSNQIAKILNLRGKRCCDLLIIIDQ